MVDNKSIKHDLKVYLHSLKLQLRSSASLRGAFTLQILGMIFNNIIIIFAWVFLFKRFGTINGWSSSELIGLNAINMTIYGFITISSGGIRDLSRHVDNGSLDGLLTKPSPVLLQLAGGNLEPSALGDILLGITMTIWYMSISDISSIQLILFILALVIGMIIFWCFAILLPSLISFYIFDSEKIAYIVRGLFLDSYIYPTGVLTGPIRSILLTIVPSLFIGSVPLEILYRFKWQVLIPGLFVAVFWLCFSLWLFKRSIRRYESSNLIGAR